MRFVSATVSIECGERLSAAPFQSSAFSPTLLWGRRWRSRMRGRRLSRKRCRHGALAEVRTPCRSIARHPSSAFGTFSPRRSPRGEGARFRSAAKESGGDQRQEIRDKRQEIRLITHEVCQRHCLNRARREVVSSTLPIERLLPHAFVGEKVAKPDEGASTLAKTLQTWSTHGG